MAHVYFTLDEWQAQLPPRFHPLFGDDFRIEQTALRRLLDQALSQRDADLIALTQGLQQLTPDSLPPCDAHGLLPPHGFIGIHTLNLLAETRQASFWEALLPILRQPEAQLKALFGNFLTESLWEVFYHLPAKNWALPGSLLREDEPCDEVKESILVCIAQFAWHQPVRRAEVFAWFRKVLKDLNAGALVFSQPLLGALVKELGDLRASALQKEVELLWEKTDWPVGLTGTLEQWIANLDAPANGWAKRPIHNLASRYRFYVSTLFPSSPENKADAVRIDLPAPARPKRAVARSFARPKTPLQKGKKVGRNDPCPCGSGKKYKKCHGK